MIWIILVGIVIFFIIKMTVSYQKDNVDLQENNLQKKFHVLISRINESAFNSTGIITTIDKRECNLYKEGANQIINFLYSQGTLNITWKYKYFQKEVVHKKSFMNCRNLSLFEQGDMASSVIKEMEDVINTHKKSVLPPEKIEEYIFNHNGPQMNKQLSLNDLSEREKEAVATLLIVLAGADQNETEGIQDEEFQVINTCVEKLELKEEFSIFKDSGLTGVIDLLKDLSSSQKEELYVTIEELLEADKEINDQEMIQTNFIFSKIGMSEYSIKTVSPN